MRKIDVSWVRNGVYLITRPVTTAVAVMFIIQVAVATIIVWLVLGIPEVLFFQILLPSALPYFWPIAIVTNWALAFLCISYIIRRQVDRYIRHPEDSQKKNE